MVKLICIIKNASARKSKIEEKKTTTWINEWMSFFVQGATYMWRSSSLYYHFGLIMSDYKTSHKINTNIWISVAYDFIAHRCTFIRNCTKSYIETHTYTQTARTNEFKESCERWESEKARTFSSGISECGPGESNNIPYSIDVCLRIHFLAK